MKNFIQNKKKVSLIAAFIYIGLMLIGMSVTKGVFHYDYTQPEIVNILVYFEIVMTAFAIFCYVKFFKGTAFKKLKPSPILLIFSFAILISFLIYLLTGHFEGHGNLFYLVIITTFLVGVSEELMFRGIVFSGFEKDGNLKALVVSSALFSILHCVNIVAGLPFKAMLIQMIFAFIYGILAGGVRIQSENILPFMILHFLWDMIVVSDVFIRSAVELPGFIVTCLQLILAVIIFVSVWKKQKKAV